MSRRPITPRLLICSFALVGSALLLPATSVAGEVTTTTETTPSSTSAVPASPPASTQAPETTTAAAPPEASTTSTEAQTSAPRGGEAAPPQVRATHLQSTTPARRRAKRARRPRAGSATTGEGATVTTGKRAPAPSTLTPSLPFSLRSPLFGVPDFFIESFQIPPFLLPIFQAAGTAYGIPWQVLAAINEVETDYGRDLSVSSAGAEGWMQFLPSEWARYGVDANGDGWEDPYNPADAIFAAARYLRAAGGDTDIKAAVYAYNHSQEYVESVMLRAQLLDGTPPELLGAITGLTEGRFPVHAASHYSDGFPAVPDGVTGQTETLVGTTIYSQQGAPVIAVQDGEVVQVGQSPSLGNYVMLRDAYGNSYVYAELGEVASVYPVLEPRVRTTLSARLAGASGAHSKPEPAPSGPATAGAQPRTLSEGATISELALGATAALESAPSAAPGASAATTHVSAPAERSARVQSFAEGQNEVYLHPLVPGVQVIAGTILGHVGAAGGASASEEPHIVFQVRPAGAAAPLIDPKPILDGWVALEDTSIFRAKGENPFLATSPTVGQVLLESKQQLEPQVLHASSPAADGGIRLGACAREDVQEGRVDKRVLAMLEYLSVSGLSPTVSGLPCAPATPAAAAANASASDTSEAVDITAVNGAPVAGHQGPGTLADETVRKLLMLQGVARPQRIVSEMSYPGAAATVTSPSAADAIRVAYGALGARGAKAAAVSASGLSPNEWIELIDRLGEIPDPMVSSGRSSAAIPDGASAGGESAEGAVGGDN
jgi:murein DD-endopeptidase MepM/ murein hydrolase activator NlpD